MKIKIFILYNIMCKLVVFYSQRFINLQNLCDLSEILYNSYQNYSSLDFIFFPSEI